MAHVRAQHEAKLAQSAAQSDALALLQSHARTRYITALCYAMRDITSLEVFSFVRQGQTVGAHSGIADGAVQALGRFIMRNAKTLKHLDLSFNDIGASGMAVLSQMLAKFPLDSPLKVITFAGNATSEVRVQTYASWWRRLVNMKYVHPVVLCFALC